MSANSNRKSGWPSAAREKQGQVSAKNVSYNGTIAPGATVDIGFQATHTGNTAKPSTFALNGNSCSIT